jgi:thiol-disulfide isomerase/thioredoxin
LSAAPTAGRTILVTLAVLALSAAGGFVLYHFLPGGHRTTLYAATTPPGPLPREVASEDAPPAPRRIPAGLPDLALPDLQGRTHRLTEWSGQPLIINFWATWCEPCRREIPLLLQLRQQRAAEHLQVVGIAVDTRDAVSQYAGKTGIDYPVLVGEQGGLAAVNAFGMDTVLPFSVFVDRLGRIVTLKVGELHPPEAGFILDRIQEVDAGHLSLAAAQKAIAGSLRGPPQAKSPQKG